MKKRSQVWVETVIYTLIAFALIGTILAIVKPQIQEMQDKAVIEQSIGVLENINSIILDVNKVPGNQRVWDLAIKKGTLNIDAEGERIYFEIGTSYLYSQLGTETQKGNVKILTEELSSKNYNTFLILDYNSTKYNLYLKDGSPNKQITKASSLYKLSIINKGKVEVAPGDYRTALEFDVN